MYWYCHLDLRLCTALLRSCVFPEYRDLWHCHRVFAKTLVVRATRSALALSRRCSRITSASTPPPSPVSKSFQVPVSSLIRNEPLLPQRHSLVERLDGSPRRRSHTEGAIEMKSPCGRSESVGCRLVVMDESLCRIRAPDESAGHGSLHLLRSC